MRRQPLFFAETETGEKSPQPLAWALISLIAITFALVFSGQIKGFAAASVLVVVIALGIKLLRAGSSRPASWR